MIESRGLPSLDTVPWLDASLTIEHLESVSNSEEPGVIEYCDVLSLEKLEF